MINFWIKLGLYNIITKSTFTSHSVRVGWKGADDFSLKAQIYCNFRVKGSVDSFIRTIPLIEQQQKIAPRKLWLLIFIQKDLREKYIRVNGVNLEVKINCKNVFCIDSYDLAKSLYKKVKNVICRKLNRKINEQNKFLLVLTSDIWKFPKWQKV